MVGGSMCTYEHGWIKVVTVEGTKYAWAQFGSVFPCGYGSRVDYFGSFI